MAWYRQAASTRYSRGHSWAPRAVALEQSESEDCVKDCEELSPQSYNLVEPAPDRYTCMICSSLQNQPVLISCCGQHFCESCLKKWFRNQGKRCPHCRETGVSYMLNKERVRDINELQVYCSNKSDDCDWRNELGGLEQHLDQECGFAQIECPKKCKLRLLRKDCSAHLKDSCLCRDFSCEHCGQDGTYHSITGECGDFGPCELHGDGHYAECDYYPVECPNKCSETINRIDLSSHYDVCPLEPVECTFSEVGCTEELVRRELDDHVATSDHQHLLLMMKAFKESKERIEQLETEIEEVKAKHKQDIEDLERRPQKAESGVKRYMYESPCVLHAIKHECYRPRCCFET